MPGSLWWCMPIVPDRRLRRENQGYPGLGREAYLLKKEKPLHVAMK